VIRLDTVRLDAPKRTPQGGLAAPAYLTRAGVFVYKKAATTATTITWMDW
jgi:hypothetical protein